MTSVAVPAMTIGGAAVRGEATFPVVDPATGEVFAEAPDCTPEQLDAAFAAAAAAFPAFSADEDARRSLLLELGTAIVAAKNELTRILVAESGKPTALAALESTASDLWIRYFAETDIPRTVLHDDEAARIEVRHRPLGVVVAITPWNFPISSAVNKIAAALRVGDTVVLKPSPFTPLTGLRLGEILNEVLPPGVVNVVSGGDELGALMTSHPTPRKITFTGSIDAGKHVAASAGADLKRVTLELGGNDVAILLDDVDLAVTAPAVLQRAFFNTGQTCAVPKRIFVPASRYDEAVDAFAAAAETYTLGAGDEGMMGPLSTRPQYERIQELVAEAVAGSARAVTGGAAVARPGFFYEPTILADATDGLRVVGEEQFGPALPLLRYENEDEAIGRANATMFGLCGSVWGEDLDRAQALAERIECGVTYVNAHGVHRPSMPMLGVKWSGVGLENGVAGLLEFTEPQVVYRAARPTDTALT